MKTKTNGYARIVGTEILYLTKDKHGKFDLTHFLFNPNIWEYNELDGAGGVLLNFLRGTTSQHYSSDSIGFYLRSLKINAVVTYYRDEFGIVKAEITGNL